MNPKIKSIKFNFVMNLILTASSVIFPLITIRYVNRVLQVDRMGDLAFATSMLTYFSMVASLGIPTYGIRACARVRENKIELTRTVHELLIINVVSTAVVYGAFFVSLAIIPDFREEKELFLINSLSLILNTIGVSWFYSALEQYSYITVRSLVFKILSLAAMFLLIHKEADYVLYALITVLATGGSNLLNFIHLRKYISFRPIGGYNFKRHLRPVFTFFGAVIASSVYTNLDIPILKFLTDSKQVGYYQVGIKIKALLTTVVTSLGTVLIPRLSYYVQQGKKKEFEEITVKAFNFVLILASSVSLYFILFAKETILILGGEEYLGGVLPMQLLMPSILFIGFSYITGLQILVPMGNEKKMLISYIIVSAVSFVMNLLLIPHLKAAGTAFSSSFAEFTVLFIQVIYLREFLKPLVKKISFLKTIFSLAAASAATLLVKYLIYAYLSINTFFVMVITAVAFFGVLLLMLIILKETFVMQTLMPMLKGILSRGQKKLES